MSTPVFNDKAERSLQPGDLVVYAVRDGDTPAMRYGKVIKVQLSKGTDPTAKLRVVGIDDRFSGPAVQKACTLEYSSRVLKIEEAQVPPAVLKLLAGVPCE